MFKESAHPNPASTWKFLIIPEVSLLMQEFNKTQNYYWMPTVKGVINLMRDMNRHSLFSHSLISNSLENW